LKKKDVKNINAANVVTLIRLLIGAPLIYFIYSGKIDFALVLYMIFLALDMLDGFLARRLKCETLLGKNLDFITDTAVGLGVFILLILKGIIPTLYAVLLAILFVVKAAAVLTGIKKMKKTFIPSKWRKLNGAVFYAIPLLFMINFFVNESRVILVIAYLLLAYAYISTIKYLKEILDVC
jgi:phosphatidylglycerophosphate synthase